MKYQPWLAILVGFLILGFSCVSNACAQGAPPELSPSYLTDMHNRVGDVTMTVYPVDLPKMRNMQMGSEFAKGLALMLERAGFKHVEVAKQALKLQSSDGNDISALTKEVSSDVVAAPVKTDYAYQAQFIGTQQTGPTAILTVVVNKQGNVVWSDMEKPDSEMFKRLRPNDPLSCCYLSVEGLCQAANLVDPNSKNAQKGRWSGYFDLKSKAQKPDNPILRIAAWCFVGLALILIAVIVRSQLRKWA